MAKRKKRFVSSGSFRDSLNTIMLTGKVSKERSYAVEMSRIRDDHPFMEYIELLSKVVYHITELFGDSNPQHPTELLALIKEQICMAVNEIEALYDHNLTRAYFISPNQLAIMDTDNEDVESPPLPEGKHFSREATILGISILLTKISESEDGGGFELDLDELESMLKSALHYLQGGQ